MERSSRILLIGELQDEKPAPVTLELIGEGKKIASSLNAELILAVAGSGIQEISRELLEYPVDRIIAADHPGLGQKQTEVHSKVLETVIREQEPDIVLGGATLFGRVLISALAAALGTEVITDAAGLEIERETGKLLVSKPAFDGKRMSVVSMPKASVQIVAVKPGIFEKACKTGSQRGSITMAAVEWPEDIKGRVKILEHIAGGDKKISLEDAKIIAAGGRGLKGPEGFELLRLFAERIGAQVGSTRPCVDAGWTLPEQQIGQTGCIVKPDLYLAFGVSGAVQHMTGVRAKTVVAVNNNPNAAIFKYCDYGIVGDAGKILKEFLMK